MIKLFFAWFGVFVALGIALLNTALAEPVCDAPVGKNACTYQQNVAQTCVAWACLPDDPNGLTQGAAGHCGACSVPGAEGPGARECGGRACLPDGRCDAGPIIPTPVPVRPQFHLIVADVTVPLADAKGYSGRPIVGPGYVYQLGLTKTKPKPGCDGGWSSDVPKLYLDLGASLALAGKAQNLFANVGLSYHLAGRAIGISHLSLGGIYQRAGSSIWDVRNATVNVDRLGPALGIGFLYNLFLRVSYVWALSNHGAHAHDAVLLSVIYMHDLVDDLLPDRFKKYIPKQYRGD